MPNLSQIKRQRMLEFLQTLREFDSKAPLAPSETFPQTPEIVSFTHGCAFKER